MEATDDKAAEGAGQRVRLIRKKHGLTQKAFGKAIGRVEGTVQQWETEKLKLTRPAALLVSQHFDIDPEWLWSNEGPEPSWPTPRRAEDEESAVGGPSTDRMRELEVSQAETLAEIAEVRKTLADLQESVRLLLERGDSSQGGRG